MSVNKLTIKNYLTIKNCLIIALIIFALLSVYYWLLNANRILAADENEPMCSTSNADCDEINDECEYYGFDWINNFQNYHGGGDAQCCGDDSREYYLQYTRADNSKADFWACCDDSSDCVSSSGQCFNSNSSAFGTYICQDNKWYVCDKKRSDTTSTGIKVGSFCCTGSTWMTDATEDDYDCSDGLDNDCDCYVDEDDKDCGGSEQNNVCDKKLAKDIWQGNDCEYVFTKAMTFDERKQLWLSRNGADPDGGYDDRNCYYESYIFAHLEKSQHSSVVNEQVDICLNHIDAAGSSAILTLMRAVRQFGSELGSTKDKILKIFKDRFNNQDNAVITNRMTGNPVQMEASVGHYIYLLYDNKNQNFVYSGSGNGFSAGCPNCSGTNYTNGKTYNALNYTRDKIYALLAQVIEYGYRELDGNYNKKLIESLLLLYDYGEPEMKKVAKMALDFFLLEDGLEYAGNQRGGSPGRIRLNSYIANEYIDSHLYPLLGLGADKNSSSNGHFYMTTYRPSELIQRLVHVEKEADDYWHLHIEKNATGGNEGSKWTYVTPYYTIGAEWSGDNGANWVMTLKTFGESFKLWVNNVPFDADDDDNKFSSSNPPTGWSGPGNWESWTEFLPELGSNGFYHYNNAFFLNNNVNDLHIVRIDDAFDKGEENLIDRGLGFSFDYNLKDSGWNFFQNGKVMLAIANKNNYGWAVEAEIQGVNFNSLSEFQSASRNFDKGELKTGNGMTINGNNTYGAIAAKEKDKDKNFFNRMETVSGNSSGVKGNLTKWKSKGDFVITKNDLRCGYNFNNYTYSGNGCEGGQDIGSSGEESGQCGYGPIDPGGGGGNGSGGSSNGGGVADDDQNNNNNNLLNPALFIANFNCDDRVDIQDFGILLSHWAQVQNIDNYQHTNCLSSRSLDLNKSGAVDYADFGILFSCWGNPTKEECLLEGESSSSGSGESCASAGGECYPEGCPDGYEQRGELYCPAGEGVCCIKEN